MICDHPNCGIDLTGRKDTSENPYQHSGPAYVIVHDRAGKTHNLCVPCYLEAYTWQVSVEQSDPCDRCGGTGRIPKPDLSNIMIGKVFIP
jgi:hypothetical protein